MTPPPASTPPAAPPRAAPSPDDVEAPPAVPGFTTWRGVYLFVFVVFVGTVVALYAFSRAYA